MTVAELIQTLKLFPSARKVIVDSCSDYCEVTDVTTIALVDRNGYLSTAFYGQPLDKEKEEDCVYLC